MRIALLSGRSSYYFQLQKILQNNGLSGEFRSFSSAGMLFRTMQYRFFDLVFLDGNLSDMDGPTVSAVMREKKSGNNRYLCD